MELGDWEKLRTAISGTQIKGSNNVTDTTLVQENHQEIRKEKQSQIEALADAICSLLDWQSRQLQRKAEAQIKAMQRRYQDKVIENKRLL